MNKKLRIALWISFAVLGIAYLVLYILFKEQVTFYTECVIDFINRPLPIVGVSLVVILLFVWKIVITSKVGKKKIAEYQEGLNLVKREFEEYKAHINEKMALIEEQANLIKDKADKAKEMINGICELTHNVKIKQLKGLIYEEESDSDTEEK